MASYLVVAGAPAGGEVVAMVEGDDLSALDRQYGCGVADPYCCGDSRPHYVCVPGADAVAIGDLVEIDEDGEVIAVLSR